MSWLPLKTRPTTSVKKLTQDQFEIVYPSYTILSEAPVAVVDSVVDKKGTRAAAEAYLQNLWSEPAQELAANLYLRPRNAEVLAKHKADFPDIETFNPNEKFWPVGSNHEKILCRRRIV